MMEDFLLSRWLTKRHSVYLLIGVFILIALWITSYPYRVMTMDIADATTNYIWVQQYAHGIFAVPYSQWTYGTTQSVVVLHNGQYFVLNEKGPGFGMLLVPFFLAHATWLFAPVMVAMAVSSTYMLAYRLANWKVAFFAALITMLNTSVLVMWSHYYWTDAATMHLLVFSIWLLVEANYWYNGKSLLPSSGDDHSSGRKILSISLAILSGLAFGAAVSTRYPAALILPALFIYMITFYLIRSRSEFRKGTYRKGFGRSSGILLLVFFLIGLAVVLVPLFQYNSTYFGGPLNSGYDATTLLAFSHNQVISPRNQSQNWFASVSSDFGNAAVNFVYLLPLLVFRMPALVLLPFGLWIIRKNRSALALLAPWIFIALFTYLSLSWITQYDSARIYLQTAWEPRYFMPAIPPLSILAGMTLERSSKISGGIKNTKNRGDQMDTEGTNPGSRQRIYPSLIFLIAVAAFGLIPMILFFSHNGGTIVAPGLHGGPVNNRPPLKTLAAFINLIVNSTTR